MNSRRFNRSKSIRTRLARAELQDIELAANSQRISERLYNPLATRMRPALAMMFRLVGHRMQFDELKRREFITLRRGSRLAARGTGRNRG
jgi:hypothetical protein